MNCSWVGNINDEVIQVLPTQRNQNRARRGYLVKIGKSQLIRQSKGKACMLQHVIETQIFQFVLGGVDFLVRVLEVGFDHECGWIAGFGGGSVVGAGVAAFREDVRDVTILYDFCQPRFSRKRS